MGRLLLLAVGVSVAAIVLLGIHPFLAVNAPVRSAYLAVEGWIPDYAVCESLLEFRTKGYTLVVTTGGPLMAGVDLDLSDTYAHSAGKRLVKFGLSPEALAIVPAPGGQRDRTYASAVALREWFDAQGARPDAMNIVSIGAHARRTRLLFRRAFGASTDVGIIAIENREYEQEKWWQYSEGVKECLSEGAAYLYAKFFFLPEK